MLSSPSTYWSEIKQGARDEEICIFKRKRERDDDEISPPVSLPKSSPNSGGGSIDHGHVAAAFSCGARPGGRCARGIIHRWAGPGARSTGDGSLFHLCYDRHGRRTPMAARTVLVGGNASSTSIRACNSAPASHADTTYSRRRLLPNLDSTFGEMKKSLIAVLFTVTVSNTDVV